MTIPSILVTSDNYWIGGRETFLSTYLSLLKRRAGTRVFLLAERTSSAVPPNVFEEVVQICPRQRPTIKAWLDEGSKLVARARPGLLWSQHYRVLPAWLLAVVHEVPLHVTFHGSLLGAGRLGGPQEALGATLAIHRGGMLSAVSQEIADELLLLGAGRERICLMPNKVFVPAPVGEERQRLRGKPVRLVMLTRQQKLAHIRAAVRFLHEIKKQGHRAELVIYSGLAECGDRRNSRIHERLPEAIRRLGRRWLLNNPQLISDLLQIDFRPPTIDPARAISAANMVLGMGRVVLEGLAAAKPTILIGYDQVIGLVTAETFSIYEHANFSGRGIRGQAIDAVAKQSIAAVFSGNAIDGSIRKLIDIDESWEEFRKTCEKAARSAWNSKLSKVVSARTDALVKGALDEQGFLDDVREALTVGEIRTYETLLSVMNPRP